MKDNLPQTNFFLSCPRGLEDFLEQEARQILGDSLRALKQEDGGIKVGCELLDFLKLMLSSRIASRGHQQLGQWPLKDLHDLPILANEFAFEDVMDVRQSIKVNTLFDSLAKRELKNSMVASQMFKDGIVDRFRFKVGQRPNVDLKQPDVTFLLRIEGARNAKKYAPYMLTLYVDLAGDPLSNRSYRLPEHTAPLRENVAAGLVYKAAMNNDDTFFLDPFIGTGTIVAEAMMIKSGALPSYLNLPRLRQYYAFARLRRFRDDKNMAGHLDDWARNGFEKSRQSLSKMDKDFFFGSDIDANAINTTRKTMLILGVEKHVTLNVASALVINPPKTTPGVIVTNPPYGERLSSPEEAAKMYMDFTEHLKQNFKGCRAFLLAGDPKANTLIRLKPSCKMPVFNGDIDCRLLGYNFY